MVSTPQIHENIVAAWRAGEEKIRCKIILVKCDGTVTILKCKWPCGSVYEGHWTVDGSVCAGDYVDRAILNGKVAGKYHDGSVYEGDLKDGKLHGKGIFKWVSGSVYKGDWKDDKRHGKGTYKYARGIYEGDWKDDKRHGKGTIKWECGNVYEGEWMDGKLHGKGTLKYANGGVYEGRWKDGRKHGKGTLYEGRWKDDRKHGKGTLKYANGDVYEGRWYRGGTSYEKGIYKDAKTMKLTPREQNIQVLSKKVLKKTIESEYSLRYHIDTFGERLRRIRSLYLLLLRNRIELTAPQFITDANHNVHELPLECPANRGWKLTKDAFYKAVDVKQYIRENIREGNHPKYYNPRLALVTLTKWQKHVHAIVLNDAISYYKKVPNKMPIEVKSRIVSYLITPYILPHL